MNRREFLIHATIGGVTVPLLITEIGCSEDDGGPGPGTGSETFDSTSISGHTHSVTIPDSDLTAGGDHSYPSTNNSGHSHRLDLLAQDIDNLTLGCVVIAPSTLESGHQHSWRIVFADFVNDVQTTSQPDGTAHSHTVTVAAEDLTTVSPPTQRTITTSISNNHSHDVELTLADYTALQNCGSVTKTTTADGTGHSHSFLITRA